MGLWNICHVDSFYQIFPFVILLPIHSCLSDIVNVDFKYYLITSCDDETALIMLSRQLADFVYNNCKRMTMSNDSVVTMKQLWPTTWTSFAFLIFFTLLSFFTLFFTLLSTVAGQVLQEDGLYR